MERIVFATNNLHKLEEIAALMPEEIQILGLKEIGFEGDIPEDFETLEENAFQKAAYIFDRHGISCFADDTGLEIDALNGEPGVYSARYSRMGSLQYPDMEVAAGNIRKVLESLEGSQNRRARFRTVIALILGKKRYTFEGMVEGEIIPSLKGEKGFGYDPIFKPLNYDETFAEMDFMKKNEISHRAIAVKKLIHFLESM